VLADLLCRDRLVIAAGGGAVLAPETRERMGAAGPVVWLQASVDEILARLQADVSTTARRPSLTGHDPRIEVETLLAARQPLYAEIATIVVHTDGRSTQAVVDEVLTQLPPLPGEAGP
jgi:shikimate kinase